MSSFLFASENFLKQVQAFELSESTMSVLKVFRGMTKAALTSSSKLLGGVLWSKRKVVDRFVPCYIQIPANYPDGKEVESEKIESFLQTFDQKFGGSTVWGINTGRWMDKGVLCKEPMLRVEVAMKVQDIPSFREIAFLIGKETQQKCMYILTPYGAEFIGVD